MKILRSLVQLTLASGPGLAGSGPTVCTGLFGIEIPKIDVFGAYIIVFSTKKSLIVSLACNALSLLPWPLTINSLFALEKCIIGPFRGTNSTLLEPISNTSCGPRLTDLLLLEC